MTGVLIERENWGLPGWLLAKLQTLGFDSGFGLRVVGSSPVSGSAPSGESAGDSLARPLPLPRLLVLTCTL